MRCRKRCLITLEGTRLERADQEKRREFEGLGASQRKKRVSQAVAPNRSPASPGRGDDPGVSRLEVGTPCRIGRVYSSPAGAPPASCSAGVQLLEQLLDKDFPVL